jgi:hypothetical protein
MEILFLIGVIAAILFAVWKWAVRPPATVSILPTETVAKVVYPPVIEEHTQPFVEMAVTDGPEDVPAKKVRKPRKKSTTKAPAKKVVKKPRARKPNAQ